MRRPRRPRRAGQHRTLPDLYLAGSVMVTVAGKTVDNQSRCVHYQGPTDVVAIKFRCCGLYYPCFDCHRECADHPAQQWPVDEWDVPAILCGVCGTELPIRTYFRVTGCPACGATFNPGCRLHHHLYFASTGQPGA